MDIIIIHYLDGTATKEEAEALLTWIKESEENLRYFTEVRDLWLSSGSAYPSVEGRMAFEKFKKYILNTQKRKRLFTIARFTAAAIIGFAVLFTGTQLLKKMPDLSATIEETTDLPVIWNTFITTDGKRTVTLPDGTLVWLNVHSTLTYPESFTGENRTVTLEGEGYFEVVTNPENPFIVQTGSMDIRVLGTRFNVRHYRDREITETTLLSGKVEVELPEQPRRITLLPDQKIAYHKEDARFTIENIDASLYALWANEQLVIENEKLGKVFQLFEYWYNIRITVKEYVNLDNRYSMTIRDESEDEMLRLLSIITKTNYTIKNKHVTIY